MAKSLTFFAIQNNKPAFGIEGSKNFGTHFRAYYHLLALEKFMEVMGIEFERDFKMTPLAVKDIIDNCDIQVALYDNKLLLPVGNARNYLFYIPMKKNANVEYTTDHPLVAVVEKEQRYRVCYGNRRMALIYPQYFEYDDSISTVAMQIDGSDKVIPLGTVVNVNENFMVKTREGYRVNVIGFSNGKEDEGHDRISKERIPERFSIDNAGKLFRVEIYKEDKFSGMVLVNFDPNMMIPTHTVASVSEEALEEK